MMHKQVPVTIDVDEGLQEMIQIILNDHQGILPIASCQNDNESGNSYLLITILHKFALRKFKDASGLEEEEYIAETYSIPIPRWRFSWPSEETPQITQRLKAFSLQKS